MNAYIGVCRVERAGGVYSRVVCSQRRERRAGCGGDAESCTYVVFNKIALFGAPVVVVVLGLAALGVHYVKPSWRR